MAFNYVKAQLFDPAPVYYMVDSDYRTAAQGWTRADGTGPLDLFNHRNPDRVFYAPGGPVTTYATDAAAIQAANDAMVDYRGDTLFFTPGNYSIATAVTVNVPYARWLGREYKSPHHGCSPAVRNTTITAAITNALTLSATNGHDGMELGYLRFVPITADESVLFSGAGVGLYWHDFLVDFHGVAESAATAFSAVTADGGYNFSQFDHFTWLVDEAQGPMFDIAGDIRQTVWSNFRLIVDEVGAAYVTGLWDIAAGGNASDGLVFGPGTISACTGTTSTVLTSLGTSVALTGADAVHLVGIIGGTTPTVNALEAGTAADYQYSLNYMATTGGTLYAGA